MCMCVCVDTYVNVFLSSFLYTRFRVHLCSQADINSGIVVVCRVEVYVFLCVRVCECVCLRVYVCVRGYVCE